MSENFSDLAIITEAVYQTKMSRLRRLVSQESQLRRSLAKLDDLARDNQAVLAETFAMQASGADLLWDAWVMRQKIQLNSRLANILVDKAGVMQEMQQAFGRAQVTERLLGMQTEAALRAQEDRSNGL